MARPVAGINPASPGSSPRDTGASPGASQSAPHYTYELLKQEEMRWDLPASLLGACPDGPVCQDAQGARQEVPLPPAPAAAALLAAH